MLSLNNQQRDCVKKNRGDFKKNITPIDPKSNKNYQIEEKFVNTTFDDSCPESFKNSPAKIAIFNYLGKDEALTIKCMKQ